MKPLKLIILSLLWVIAATSCGDDGPYSDAAALYDIVTYEGTTSAGATFSFRQYDDSPLITLTAKGAQMSDRITAGDRLLIGYYPASGQPYTSGEITLQAYSYINQDTVVCRQEKDLAGWDKDPMYLNSVWRSGKYLNLYVRIDQSDEPRRFELAIDQATINDSLPHLYMVHDLLDSPGNYTRRAYASYDLTPVWKLETCRGIILHINDSNLQKDIYTFRKTNNQSDNDL